MQALGGLINLGLFLSTLPARGATRRGGLSPYGRYFYPRSPRGERRTGFPSILPSAPFLSTLPARGATYQHQSGYPAVGFLSTLPARGATFTLLRFRQAGSISIHAPREGSDSNSCSLNSISMISIHAPREGSDGFRNGLRRSLLHFYPRSPRGERPALPAPTQSDAGFLSTLPARGATAPACRVGQDAGYFYPRSPRGERLAA